MKAIYHSIFAFFGFAAFWRSRIVKQPPSKQNPSSKSIIEILEKSMKYVHS